MLTTQQEIDQFLVLQSKSLSELVTISSTLGINLIDDQDKDKVIGLIMGAQKLSQAYAISKPQAISLRTAINGQNIPGAADFMRKIRMLMYKFNKKKEFELINPKDVTYPQVMNYLPCEQEHMDTLLELDMILAKPEQADVCIVMNSGLTSHEFEINFINKPAANSKSFVMLHVQSV